LRLGDGPWSNDRQGQSDLAGSDGLNFKLTPLSRLAIVVRPLCTGEHDVSIRSVWSAHS
jgi:hypothetical protein